MVKFKKPSKRKRKIWPILKKTKQNIEQIPTPNVLELPDKNFKAVNGITLYEVNTFEIYVKIEVLSRK